MKIQDHLQKISNGTGISSCLIVSKDGLIVDNAGSIKASLTSLATQISSAFDCIDKFRDILDFGKSKQTTLEYDKGKLIICQINDKLLLLVITTNMVNLGITKYTINEVLDDLRYEFRQ